MPARLILVGQLAGAFGVRGEVRITAFTQDPLNLLSYSPLRREVAVAMTLERGRAVKGALIANAREVGTREAAEALRGLRLYAGRDAFPEPEEDEYYAADLVGLEARSPAGEALGRVKSVHDFGAGDLLEIQPADPAPSWWAPFTHAVVPDILLSEGLVIVDRPPETGGE